MSDGKPHLPPQMTRRLAEMRDLKRRALEQAAAEGKPEASVPSPMVLSLMERFGISREEAEMWEDTT
jgi:hypothetical protein